MQEAFVAPLAPARRPRRGDLALPAVLAAFAFAEAVAAPGRADDPLLAALAPPLLALPLVWRRTRPLAVCWCVTLLFALIAATDTVDLDATSGCSLVALFAVGCAACHAERLRGVLLAAAGAAVLGALTTGMFADGPPAAGDLLFGLVFVFGAVGLGRAVHGGALRRLRLAVELDAARSERAAAEQAARHERRRLAHELHDLGSHHLVVATLHAAIAARATAAGERGRAREAFAIVRDAVTRTADALASLTGAAPAMHRPRIGAADDDAPIGARCAGRCARRRTCARGPGGGAGGGAARSRAGGGRADGRASPPGGADERRQARCRRRGHGHRHV